MKIICPICFVEFHDTFYYSLGRPRIYCSDKCKMKAYRQRKSVTKSAAALNKSDKFTTGNKKGLG